MQVQLVTTPTRPYWNPPTTCVTQQAVSTAPVATPAIHAHPMATALEKADSRIEAAGVQTSHGNRRTATQGVETVKYYREKCMKQVEHSSMGPMVAVLSIARVHLLSFIWSFVTRYSC